MILTRHHKLRQTLCKIIIAKMGNIRLTGKQGWLTKSATTSIDSNSLPSPASPAQKGASQTIAGAIVGGTIGSVGSLALVAFLAVFCLRRHRHRRSLREPVAALNDDHEFRKAEMADDPLKEIEGKPRYSF